MCFGIGGWKGEGGCTVLCFSHLFFLKCNKIAQSNSAHYRCRYELLFVCFLIFYCPARHLCWDGQLRVAFSHMPGLWRQVQWIIPCLCFFCVLFFFFFLSEDQYVRTNSTLLGQGSVHSGSASWEDCGWAFPTKIYLSGVPWWIACELVFLMDFYTTMHAYTIRWVMDVWCKMDN